jgi:hypothetical protein
VAKPCYEETPNAFQKLTSPSGRYYIQCVRTWQGDSIVWWCADRTGYTFRIDKAGTYNEEEARHIERIRGEELAVPVEIAERAATRHVTGQDLRDALQVEA